METLGSIPTIQEYLENKAIIDWMFTAGESRKRDEG